MVSKTQEKKLDAARHSETGGEKQGDTAVKRARARPGEGRARIAAQDAKRAELATQKAAARESRRRKMVEDVPRAGKRAAAPGKTKLQRVLESLSDASSAKSFEIGNASGRERA